MIKNTTNDTGALDVANSYEDNVFRQLKDPSNNRDFRSMSNVFVTFAEIIHSNAEDTFSYILQAYRKQKQSKKGNYNISRDKLAAGFFWVTSQNDVD